MQADTLRSLLVLLAIELPLVWLAIRRTADKAHVTTIARYGIFLIPIVLAMGLRTWEALATAGVLEWDETYYFSQAVTAADGRGLYPYVFGYSPMPILGGQGYAAYLYACAVLIAGPSLVALRMLSVIASGLAVLAFWLLVRQLYGTATAWTGAALLVVLRLFLLSNSIRTDSFTLAWVCFSLWLVARAFTARHSPRAHALAGLAFGAGLQFHLDSVVSFAACALLYLVIWIRDVRRGGFRFPTALSLFVGGWAVGLAAFVCFNVLPDPDAFYRTTVLIRVDATSWYSQGTTSVTGSFLSPGIIMAKEIARYSVLGRALHRLEIGLFVVAVIALLVRRQGVDLGVFTVVIGVLLASAVVLNNASPLYFIHVIPALVVPMAALLTHGVSGRDRPSLSAVGAGPLVSSVLVFAALFAVNNAKRVPVKLAPPEPALQALVSHARQVIPQNCRIAGDGDLYVRYFPDYPFFISLRPTEVSYALLFHGLENESEYWEMKRPGAVLSPRPLSEGLARYVSGHGFTESSPGIWVQESGCDTGP